MFNNTDEIEKHIKEVNKTAIDGFCPWTQKHCRKDCICFVKASYTVQNGGKNFVLLKKRCNSPLISGAVDVYGDFYP